MGDSQEREFVSMFKHVNGSRAAVTKYGHVSHLHALHATIYSIVEVTVVTEMQVESILLKCRSGC